MKRKNIKALALFSGGLDSILAAHIVMQQGIEVEAVQCVTPFFHYNILQNIEQYKKDVFRKYGFSLHLEDLSDAYLQMLHNPQNGFGKHFNPCIDCKIMMIQRTKALMAERGASFLISGEVLGQRPMSQRRNTLNRIELYSDIRSLLLRPLSAKLMEETEPEIQGWVDRSKLYAISGRGRSQQMALAKKFGIIDYPAPAGGCTLTDPILSKRIQALYKGEWITRREVISASDICCLLVGRQFRFLDNFWLIIGRNEQENKQIEALAQSDDILFFMVGWPGPSALLKHGADSVSIEMLQLVASLIMRYAKRVPVDDPCQSRRVGCVVHGEQHSLVATAFVGDDCQQWQMI